MGEPFGHIDGIETETFCLLRAYKNLWLSMGEPLGHIDGIETETFCLLRA